MAWTWMMTFHFKPLAVMPAPPTAAASDAERQRLCRKRKREQVRPMSGDVPIDLVDALVKNDWLALEEAKAPRNIGVALINLADCWLRKTLVPPKT